MQQVEGQIHLNLYILVLMYIYLNIHYVLVAERRGRMYLLQLSQSTTRAAAAALTFSSALTLNLKLGSSPDFPQSTNEKAPFYQNDQSDVVILQLSQSTGYDSYSRSFNFCLNFDSTSCRR